ncbi:TetR/AcrR family transcriptional regulator [Saccharothrix syringae]|uniref:TetR/AcrR family transcriptional regulator n=1 Tax=Saccharothrix syringae TaxID=103733 RepID=A0A5Q0H3N3_SACSY|nr:TetR/AcrR family transcriptional regulator [Saccharothrix syringae]QFZ20729.1 TetR/AcrR family transcriptional regulator [Saccharothrix syringae]
MSPRKLDPEIRTALVDIAARLLAEHGAEALSTRKIAAEAGTSTMAVYTYFGGMSGLVREMVHEGFARLERQFARVRRTDDPVADMLVFGHAYRHNAKANSHLYAVMFGGQSLAGFSLTEDDRQYGRYTLVDVVGCVTRCVEAGRFRQADPLLVAHQMWIATHGLVNLELGGYLVDPVGADRCYENLLGSLVIGVGDTAEAMARSTVAANRRVRREVTSTPEAVGPRR